MLYGKCYVIIINYVISLVFLGVSLRNFTLFIRLFFTGGKAGEGGMGMRVRICNMNGVKHSPCSRNSLWLLCLRMQLVVDNMLPFPIITSYCTTLCYSSSVAKQHGNLKNSSHHSAKGIYCHASLTHPPIPACYSPSKLLLGNRLTGSYVNVMQLACL